MTSKAISASAAVGGRTAIAYERIRGAILDGTMKPGAPLIEVALAEMCGVSRTPVREALMHLEHDGLVVRVGSGLVVREHSAEEVLDIYETRIALEETAARLAADRRTSYDMISLRRVIGRLEGLEGPSAAEMAAANQEFHRTIWRTSRNVSLIDLLEKLDQHLARYSSTTLIAPGRWHESNIQHREIVEAIEARDGEQAGHLAAIHFTAARDIRLRLFESDDLR